MCRQSLLQLSSANDDGYNDDCNYVALNMRKVHISRANCTVAAQFDSAAVVVHRAGAISFRPRLPFLP